MTKTRHIYNLIISKLKKIFLFLPRHIRKTTLANNKDLIKISKRLINKNHEAYKLLAK